MRDAVRWLVLCKCLLLVVLAGCGESVSKGDYVYVDNELGKAYIAVNKSTWNAFIDTYESKDSAGRVALIMSRSVFVASAGTRCLVLDTDWELIKVRVLEGSEEGKSGYTLRKLFSKSR